MDPALWDELEGWAQAELRSVNGQRVHPATGREQTQRRKARSARGRVRSEGNVIYTVANDSDLVPQL